MHRDNFYPYITMVGTGGFEPPTPRTPSVCATRLRHVPNAPLYTRSYGEARIKLLSNSIKNQWLTKLLVKRMGDFFQLLPDVRKRFF